MNNIIFKHLKKDDLAKIADANHHNPFSLLGRHTRQQNDFLLIFSPDTKQLTLTKNEIPMARLSDSDFFICNERLNEIEQHYLVNRIDANNNTSSFYDPYSFA
ncbi:MAG: hypothetical protein KAJ39_10090, partial [Gammaproteobacteria bacterium]|nr:hypothetical protein [Gammaproteobacteria bacterium]